MDKIISIYSGMDVLGMGFAEDFEIVLAVENEKLPCELMKKNKAHYAPHMTVWQRDIYEITDEEILVWKDAKGIVGGPNCQPFSPAKGSFDPKDPRIRGLEEYLRWVKLIQPEFFVFENTFGIMEGKKKVLFENFQKQAEELGYVVEAKVVVASDYGNAQIRKRMMAIGVQKDAQWRFTFPDSVPENEKKYGSDLLDPNDVGPALSYSKDRAEIIRHVPPGGHWRQLPSDELKIRALGEKNFYHPAGGMTGAYRRLHPDKHCPTLTTNPCQRNTMVAHPYEDRPLSLHEYKRAFGIPSWYQLTGNLNGLYKVIGNAVPFEMAQKISKQITALR